MAASQAYLTGEKDYVINLEEHLSHRHLNPELFGGPAFAPESRAVSGERGGRGASSEHRKSREAGSEQRGSRGPSSEHREGRKAGSEQKAGRGPSSEYGGSRGASSEYGGGGSGRNAAERLVDEWKERNLGRGAAGEAREPRAPLPPAFGESQVGGWQTSGYKDRAGSRAMAANLLVDVVGWSVQAAKLSNL
jgi:hypothetical protein